MARAKSLKLCYTKQPENCPMCGKRTVEELSSEEKESLHGEQGPIGSVGNPQWRCASCGAVLWRCESDEESVEGGE